LVWFGFFRGLLRFIRFAFLVAGFGFASVVHAIHGFFTALENSFFLACVSFLFPFPFVVSVVKGCMTVTFFIGHQAMIRAASYGF
jgi:hypothetical protein